MAPGNMLVSSRVTMRASKGSSENSFAEKHKVYSKRKAEFSPPKTKNTKRPALNNLTNDVRLRKVKSIVENEKARAVTKDKKCIENGYETVEVKSSRATNAVRLPSQLPHRKPAPAKTANESRLKAADSKAKPTSKSAVQQTKSGMVQTLLTAHSGKSSNVLRRSARLQNEKEASRLEEPTKREETETRKSLRSRESTSMENLAPIVVLTKLEDSRLKVSKDPIAAVIDEVTTATGSIEKPIKRISVRLSQRRSLTTDKSLGSDSLYMSALEEQTSRDKKSLCYELTDFDKELLHDPDQVALYAPEIFYYLRGREDHFEITDYLSRLVDITKDMRMILVDWLVEVQENFELNHETLYLSVKIIDAYLDKITEIRRDKLQLVGVTAMFVACKYDERLAPLLEDFVYVCDGAYSPKDILAMEQHLLKMLNFELSFPISYSFLRRYARCARVPMPLLTLARYILELALIDYSTVMLSDSKQAAAALYLAFRMVNHGHWTESLATYTGYKLDDFKDIVLLFNSILRKKFPEEIKAVRTKYSHRAFFEVAKTRLLTDEELKKSMAAHS